MNTKLEQIADLFRELTPAEQRDVLTTIIDLSGLSQEGLLLLYPERIPAPGMIYAPAPAYGGPPLGGVRGFVEFDVILRAYGPKIDTLKVIREVTGCSLAEALQVLDLPHHLLKNVSKAEADDVRRRFEAVGATVEVRGVG